MTHRHAFAPNEFEVYHDRCEEYTVRTACGEMVWERELAQPARIPECDECRAVIDARRGS